MANLICRTFRLALPIATAALLAMAGSMVIHAQQPPNPPAIRGMQAPEAGWLGVSIEEVTAQKAQELKLSGTYGVLVAEVESDSPAAKAGLKKGDVITEYDGQRVAGVLVFRRLVRETPPGRTAKITVWRDARSQIISAEVGKDENAIGGNPFESMLRRFGNPGPNTFGFGATIPPRTLLGITGQDLSGQLGKYFGAPDGEGVLVTNVESNSSAAKAGIQAGDVITKLDGERVRTLRGLREQLRTKGAAQTVTLGVLRKGSEMSINIQPRAGRSQAHPHSIPL
jgi:serine protease Do